MGSPLQIHLDWFDWLMLFKHFLVLSLLSIGGAVTTIPDMHRYLVNEQHWLTASQFNASVAISKAAPGPNVLFIALLGWNVGINSGSTLYGFLGVLVAMLGILLPSTTLTYYSANWLHKNSHLQFVSAFKHGLAPIVVAMMIATGWIMASAHAFIEWPCWLITFIATVLVWRTEVSLFWLIFIGAVIGAVGLV